MRPISIESFVKECCDQYIALHAWPVSTVNVDPWLGNFDAADRPYAAYMVSQFLFYGDRLVDAMFLSALQSLSGNLPSKWLEGRTIREAWKFFLANLIIVPVQGEQPNPSDSGNLFVRKARQLTGVEERQLLTLENAINVLARHPETPVLLVDDFAGSGEQFLGTVKAMARSGKNRGKSIKSLTIDQGHDSVFYCNALMTEKGKSNILVECPAVRLSTGNLMGPEYSWVDPSTRMWPSDHVEAGIATIEKYSRQLGYDRDDGGLRDWRGYRQLGLGLAFEHSAPDAALPIFFCADHWHPLVRRR